MNKKSLLKDNATSMVNPNMKVHPNPAPRKMAMAIEFIEKNGLPPTANRTKKTKKSKESSLSTLQTELLAVYNFEPTEKQMQQLKDFLQKLFREELNKSKSSQNSKMVI